MQVTVDLTLILLIIISHLLVLIVGMLLNRPKH